MRILHGVKEMIWTKEQPTGPGFYWAKGGMLGNCADVVYVSPSLRFWLDNKILLSEDSQKFTHFCKIEEPQDSGE